MLLWEQTDQRPALFSVQHLPSTILQVNIGLYCNQACAHCHVESSPLRTEAMTREIIDQVRGGAFSFISMANASTHKRRLAGDVYVGIKRCLGNCFGVFRTNLAGANYLGFAFAVTPGAPLDVVPRGVYSHSQTCVIMSTLHSLLR